MKQSGLTWEERRESRKQANISWAKENPDKVMVTNDSQDVNVVIPRIADAGIELVPPINLKIEAQSYGKH